MQLCQLSMNVNEHISVLSPLPMALNKHGKIQVFNPRRIKTEVADLSLRFVNTYKVRGRWTTLKFGKLEIAESFRNNLSNLIQIKLKLSRLLLHVYLFPEKPISQRPFPEINSLMSEEHLPPNLRSPFLS